MAYIAVLCMASLRLDLLSLRGLCFSPALHRDTGENIKKGEDK